MDTEIKEVFFHYRQCPTHDLGLLQEEVEKVFDEKLKFIEKLKELSKTAFYSNHVCKEDKDVGWKKFKQEHNL